MTFSLNWFSTSTFSFFTWFRVVSNSCVCVNINERNRIKVMSQTRAKSDDSKKESKDQESIQSSTKPDPGYQCESDNVTIRHHKRELSPRCHMTFRRLLTCSLWTLVILIKTVWTQVRKSLSRDHRVCFPDITIM